MSAAALAELDAGLEVVLIDGMPKVNECVVLHRPTRTLVVADLVFNFGAESGLWRKLFLTANRAYGRTDCSRLFRAMIRDRGRFADAVRRALAWEFDRVVMGHGEVIRSGGRERLRRVFSWSGAA